MAAADSEYLELVLDAIRVCRRYRPKFGRGTAGGGLTLVEFRDLYGADAFYGWFGLDNPLMYAAHKAAGGMTSVYRQIGIGCERLFRRILKDSLELSEDDVRWSYGVDLPGGRKRILHLDGRVPIGKIPDGRKRNRVLAWMKRSANALDVDGKVFESLTGTVFEVRQGYKSKDAKRQNADIANAAAAYAHGYFPCAVILSAQVDADVLTRYRQARWSILTGAEGVDPLTSTYRFMRDVVGYDLAAFFDRNKDSLRAEIDDLLRTLLSAGRT